MKILINLATIKKGGGQNVVLNFLNSLSDIDLVEIEFHFFVINQSESHKYLLKSQNNNFTLVPKSPILRIFFEFFLSEKIIKYNNIDIIYTYFGFGFFRSNILQVSGSADSNLYFPEIDFWSHYKGIPRLKKWLIDTYRLWGIKRASAVIFENKIMEERSKVLFGLKKTVFIKPSINIKVDSKEFKLFEDNRIPKGLFLCGWQLNKNIMLIPEIAFRLKQLSIDFQFVITAPKDNSSEHNQFVEKMKSLDVIDYIKIIGPVKKEELASLYEKIDFVFLLSKLESFSNNIIEAWYYKRLLIISDELWAKSICKDAALYVDRDNVNFIAKTIQLLIENDMIKKNIIENGEKEILNYPTIKERTIEEINFIKKIYESN